MKSLSLHDISSVFLELPEINFFVFFDLHYCMVQLYFNLNTFPKKKPDVRGSNAAAVYWFSISLMLAWILTTQKKERKKEEKRNRI